MSSLPPRPGSGSASSPSPRPRARRPGCPPTRRCPPRRRAECPQVGADQLREALPLGRVLAGRPTVRPARGGPPAAAPTSPTAARARGRARCRRCPTKPFTSPSSSLTVFGPSSSASRSGRAEPRSWRSVMRRSPRTRTSTPAGLRGRPPRSASTRAATPCGSSSASGSPGSPRRSSSASVRARAGSPPAGSTGPRSPMARTASGVAPTCSIASGIGSANAFQEELAREQRAVEGRAASGPDRCAGAGPSPVRAEEAVDERVPEGPLWIEGRPQLGEVAEARVASDDRRRSERAELPPMRPRRERRKGGIDPWQQRRDGRTVGPSVKWMASESRPKAGSSHRSLAAMVRISEVWISGPTCCADRVDGPERGRAVLPRHDPLGLELVAAAGCVLEAEVRQALVPRPGDAQLLRRRLRRLARDRVARLGGAASLLRGRVAAAGRRRSSVVSPRPARSPARARS